MMDVKRLYDKYVREDFTRDQPYEQDARLGLGPLCRLITHRLTTTRNHAMKITAISITKNHQRRDLKGFERE